MSEKNNDEWFSNMDKEIDCKYLTGTHNEHMVKEIDEKYLTCTHNDEWFSNNHIEKEIYEKYSAHMSFLEGFKENLQPIHPTHMIP